MAPPPAPRIEGRRGASPALVTISSVALGILVYGGILESSARATATEKASLAIGSDVSIPVGGFQVVEGHPPFASTTVERLSGVGVYPGPAQADVLAVDPGSFAPAAYWPANLGPPLSGLVSRSEEHTSELQSRVDLVCRLLLEKKKKNTLGFWIVRKGIYLRIGW